VTESRGDQSLQVEWVDWQAGEYRRIQGWEERWRGLGKPGQLSAFTPEGCFHLNGLTQEEIEHIRGKRSNDPREGSGSSYLST
jgi:hypothetical protein